MKNFRIFKIIRFRGGSLLSIHRLVIGALACIDFLNHRIRSLATCRKNNRHKAAFECDFQVCWELGVKYSRMTCLENWGNKSIGAARNPRIFFNMWFLLHGRMVLIILNFFTSTKKKEALRAVTPPSFKPCRQPWRYGIQPPLAPCDHRTHTKISRKKCRTAPSMRRKRTKTPTTNVPNH